MRAPSFAVVLAVVPLTVACRHPPEAPPDLEALTSWFFDHMRDEDPAALADGAVRLDAWLDEHEEEALEGYTVDTLTQATVDELGDADVSLDGLIGAAVATRITHLSLDVGQSTAMDDPLDVYPDTYAAYTRDWEADPACFVSLGCDRAAFAAESTNLYPLGLTLQADFRGEYRWVDTPAGPVFVQRTWLVEPAVVSLDWLGVEAQFYIGVTLPADEGVRRVQATWVSATLGDLAVPEAYALSLVIDSLRNQDVALESWLDDHR